MTTAYDFPDLSLSPIRGDTSSSRQGHFQLSSSPLELESFRVRNPPDDGVEIVPDSDVASRSQHTLPVSSSFNRRSGDDLFENCASRIPHSRVHSTVQEDDENVIAQTSSDKAFDELENNLLRTLRITREEEEEEINGSGRESSGGNELFRLFDSNEDSPRTSILAGVRVFVLVGDCCLDSSRTLRARLREMGASLLHRPSSILTHIIFNARGDLSLLRSALSSSSPRPHLLPPQWVHECFTHLRRLPEEGFSLCDARYVTAMERASSSCRSTPSRLSDLSLSSHSLFPVEDREISTEDVTFNLPMTETQLLSKIEILSRRLDRCIGHHQRCPTRASTRGRQPLQMSNRPARPPFIPLSHLPIRRRSHDGFCYEHRRPNSPTTRVRAENRDVVGWLCEPRDSTSRFPAPPLKAHPPEVAGVDDMRRTVEVDLNRIRQTLRNNAFYKRTRGGTSQRGGASVRGGASGRGMVSQAGIAAVSGDAPIVRRARNASQRPVPALNRGSLRRGRPSILTNPSRNTAVTCSRNADSSPRSRPSPAEASRIRRCAVFTGFTKREEKELHAVACALQLKIEKEVQEDTLCVISSSGARTLCVLKAAVLNVPIVTSEWLYASQRASRLRDAALFEYPEWAALANKRVSDCRLFSGVGRIGVLEGCKPPPSALKLLIRRSGGRLTRDLSEAAWVVAPSGYCTLPFPNHQHKVIVSEKYILDCITANEVMDEEGERESSRRRSSLTDPSLLSLDGATLPPPSSRPSAPRRRII